MKSHTTILTFTLLLAVVCGCQSSKSDQLLDQAYEIHKESMAIREELYTLLDGLSKVTDSASVAMLAEIQQRLTVWDENFVEVPGYEHNHDHDHHHGHHHHANSAPNLTAQQHLDLQRHLSEEIKTLEAKLKE